MAWGDSGRLSEAVPQKTEDSKTASCPLPTPPPRPGLRGPHSPLLSAPHAPDNRTERQGRDEPQRPPRGRRWALRPGWGSPGLLGMPGGPVPRLEWRAGAPPRPQKSCGVGTAAPEQTEGCSRQEPGTPGLGAHGHTLALPRPQLLALDQGCPLSCPLPGTGLSRAGSRAREGLRGVGMSLCPPKPTVQPEEGSPPSPRPPCQPSSPRGKASGPSSGHQI